MRPLVLRSIAVVVAVLVIVPLALFAYAIATPLARSPVVTAPSSPVHVVGKAPGIARMLVFGDSLSDTGNLVRATFGVVPNALYFEGRFTNGPVWDEHVANALGVPLESWATAGAVTTGDAFPYIPAPVEAQVDAYLERVHGVVPNDALVVLWSGPNDYFQDRNEPRRVVEALMALADRLLAAGARTVLMPEALKLSGLPATGDNPARDEQQDRRVLEHNALFNARVVALRQKYPSARIATAIPQRFGNAIQEQHRLGIVDVKTACSTSGAFVWQADATKRCSDPSRHFYFDGVHPTARVHCMYATAALVGLADAGVLDGAVDEEKQWQRCTAFEPPALSGARSSASQ
jgi:phospholipase/lecithinase/hemolysin